MAEVLNIEEAETQYTLKLSESELEILTKTLGRRNDFGGPGVELYKFLNSALTGA